jgi:hypothetical protein
MVQVPGLIACESRIDDHLTGDPEHEAISEAFFLVPLLPDVGHRVPNDLADVLDDEFIFLERLASEETCLPRAYRIYESWMGQPSCSRVYKLGSLS